MRRLREALAAVCLVGFPVSSSAQQPLIPTPPPIPEIAAPAMTQPLIVEYYGFVTPRPRIRIRALHITNPTALTVEVVLREDHGERVLARLDPGATATLSDLEADGLWLRLFARSLSDHSTLDISHSSLGPADTTRCTIRKVKVREWSTVPIAGR